MVQFITPQAAAPLMLNCIHVNITAHMHVSFAAHALTARESPRPPSCHALLFCSLYARTAGSGPEVAIPVREQVN